MWHIEFILNVSPEMEQFDFIPLYWSLLKLSSLTPSSSLLAFR